MLERTSRFFIFFETLTILCSIFGIYTNPGSLNPQWVLQAQIHYHNIPNTGKRLSGVAGKEIFYLSFCYGLQIESVRQYPDYLLSMKTKNDFFFSFLMKVEVCTNVLRAESVSDIYYHKLAQKYWKLAALQFSALPSPVCRTNTDVDTLCSPHSVWICARGCLDVIPQEEASLVCLHIDPCLSEK